MMEVLTGRDQMNPARIEKVEIADQDMGRIGKPNFTVKPAFKNGEYIGHCVKFKCNIYATGNTMRDFISTVHLRSFHPILKLTDIVGCEYTINGLRTYFGLKIEGDFVRATVITMAADGIITESAFKQLLIQGNE